MENAVATKGAIFKFTPATSPLVILKPIHPLAQVVSGAFFNSGKMPVIVELDIAEALKTYITAYDAALFKIGLLKFDSLISVDNLSTKLKKNGKPIVTKVTSGMVKMAVTLPALKPLPPPPTPDPIKFYLLNFTIEFPGQAILTAS